MKSSRKHLVMLRVDGVGLRRISVICLMTLLILPVYLSPHETLKVAASNDLGAPISEVQLSAFMGTLLIFDGHTHDRSANRMAYFLSEVTGGNQSITFIQFLGKPPPPQAAGRLVAIQGQKVVRPEDNRVIIRATSFSLIERITSTQTTSQTSTAPNSTRSTASNSTRSTASNSTRSTTSSTTSTTSPTFDYSISISPPSVTISPGQTATYIASVALVGGSTQLVSLAWKSNSGLPIGTTVSINPTSGNPPYTATVAVTTTTQTTAGSYDIAVSGLAPGVGLSHQSPAVTLMVLPTTTTTQPPPPAFDFSISASPTSRTIFQTQSTTYTVTVVPLSGSTQPVNLSISGLPTGASSSLLPGTGNPTFSATLTITTSTSTPPTNAIPPYPPYTITIIGTGGGITHSTTVSLTVNRAASIINRAVFSPPIRQVAPMASGPQGYVTLLAKFGDLSTMPHDVAFYNNMIYGSTGSTVNAYFQENSYGSFSITGQVFDDWRTLSKAPDGGNDRAHFLVGGATGTCGPNDDGSCLAHLLAHVIATFPDVNFNDFSRGINVELNDNIGSMAWGSIGTIDLHAGTAKRSVTFMAPVYQTPGFHGHEMGHGLRWVHSGLDYDDPWSQMSRGTEYPCPTSTPLTCPSQSHGEEKEEQGWISQPSILTVSSPDVTVNLTRLELPTNGISLVKLPISCDLVPWSTGGSCTLYLETRMRYGFDSNLPGAGVVITKYTTQGSKEEGGEWLLRPVRATAWQVGEVYAEGDVKVSILGSGADYFTVRVQAGNPSPPAATPQPSRGCLIATATYGSELAPEVQLLRSFRDNSIMKTAAGSNFMVAFNAWYYSFSPYIASYLSNHWVERTIMKGVLYPLIAILFLSSNVYLFANPYSELAALLSGLVASSLIGIIYLGVPLSLLRVSMRQLGGRRAKRLLLKSLALGLLTGMAALLAGEMLASPTILMISASTIVLSTLFLSAAIALPTSHCRRQRRSTPA